MENEFSADHRLDRIATALQFIMRLAMLASTVTLAAHMPAKLAGLY